MAPWALMKLLHPFTPDDLLVSRKILSSIELPASTAQFVLALTDPREPEKVVYVLSVEKLSERSIDDIHSLVAATNPSSVVALVDAESVAEVLEEGDLLNSPESLDVPASWPNVIKTCFTEKIKVSGYESRAGLRALINIFGTSFHGNVFAARRAAEKADAAFEYFRIPSTATASFANDDEEGDGEEGDSDARDSEGRVPFTDRFLTSLSGLLGGHNSEHLSGATQRVATLSKPSPPSEELRILAPSVSSALADQVASSSQAPSAAVDEKSENLDGWPSFTAPFNALFFDLHELFKESPAVNQALNSAKRLLISVERGEEVHHEDLSQSRLFRVAVESVRLCWKSSVQSERKASSSVNFADFSLLPVEEKCHALLAHALQYQTRKFGSVVAVVDASSVSGIRRHWNTAVPPEVAAYAEYCFVGLDSDGVGVDGKSFNLLESPETKAAVMVSAGAVAAAGLVTLPQWASLPTFMKIFSFKIPTVLKLAWMQLKRQAVVGWASSVTSASKVVTPALKLAGSGKTIFAPSSSAKAILLKSTVSAEKTRAAAQGVVAAAERASFQAIRTAFYSLMRSRTTNTFGPRPWLVLGSCLAVGGGVLWYGDEMEHAIGIVPSAADVVKLSRGLKNLEQASIILNDVEDASWWDRVYCTLYRQPNRF